MTTIKQPEPLLVNNKGRWNVLMVKPDGNVQIPPMTLDKDLAMRIAEWLWQYKKWKEEVDEENKKEAEVKK